MDAGSLLIAALILSPALPALGSGWIDGDAAAYAVGPWNERWTHAGYVALLRIVGSWGAAPGDLLSWCASVLAAVAASRIAAREGGDPRLAAAGAAAVMLPWAPFAEVDPCWIAALAWAAAGPWWMGAVAVAVSPTALLAAPWAGRWATVAAIAGVLLLTVLSAGAWWTGERGVLGVPGLFPGRTAAAWAIHLPWLLLPAALVDRRWLLLAPLLLAPPDVPAWTLLGLAWAVAGARSRQPWVPWLVVAEVALGGWELARRTERVRAEDVVVRQIAARLGPQDRLVAPWTWGARIAVAATGDPYGIRWHPPGRFLREQRQAWCADPTATVLRVAAETCGPPCGDEEVRCVEVEVPATW